MKRMPSGDHRRPTAFIFWIFPLQKNFPLIHPHHGAGWALTLLGFNIEAESCTNDGRIDAVVQTEDHIYLFEFKLDKDDSALSQIKEKEYFKKYLLSSKKITLIGVNFDSKKGQLIDWQTEDVV